MDSKCRQFKMYAKGVVLICNIHLSKHQECIKGTSQVTVVVYIGKSIIFHVNEENKPTGSLKLILR